MLMSSMWPLMPLRSIGMKYPYVDLRFFPHQLGTLKMLVDMSIIRMRLIVSYYYFIVTILYTLILHAWFIIIFNDLTYSLFEKGKPYFGVLQKLFLIFSFLHPTGNLIRCCFQQVRVLFFLWILVLLFNF